MNVKDNERLGSNWNTTTSTEMQNFIRLFVPVNREFSLREQQGNKQKNISQFLSQNFNLITNPHWRLHSTLHCSTFYCRAVPCPVCINSLPYVSITNNSHCEFFLPVLLTKYSCTIVKSSATVFTVLSQKVIKLCIMVDINIWIKKILRY
jgi:hypothetical protein